MHITELSIKRPAMMTMVIMFFVVLGLYTYGRIGTELFPAINTPYVTVSVSYPGAGAEEIETQIIKPIEENLASLSQLKHINSMASVGRANVSLEFDLTADADEAAIDVQKKVDAISGRFPDGAGDPVVIKRDMNDQPIMTLSLSSKRPQYEIYDLANDIVKERLQRLTGVTEVAISGGQQREIQINIDKTRLEGYGLTLNQVISRLEEENLDDPSGRIDRPEAEYNLRVLGQFRSINDIAAIHIPTSSGYPVPLKDIATVTEGYQEVRAFSRLNGTDAVSIQIYKQSDASVVAVGKTVKNELDVIKKELPTDSELIISNDSSDYVQRSLNGTWSNILEGIITTGLALFIFLRQWRSTLIVMLAIPTSLIATVMMMYFSGFTFNMMSLMGLALCIGILVDDSIVVLENIHRHVQMGKSPYEAAIEGRREIGMAAIAITMSDIVVFMPIALMNGMVGQFFRQFGMTVVFATLFSLFISFTLTPMLASRLYKQKLNPESGEGQEHSSPEVLQKKRQSIFAFIWKHTIPLGRKVKQAYLKQLDWSFNNRKKVLAFSVLAFLLSLTVIPLKLVGMEFAPKTDQGQISVSLEMPIGTPIGKTDAAVRKLEAYLSKVPELQFYQTSVGGGGGRGASTGSNTGRISLQLYPKTERERSVWEVADGIRKWSKSFKEGRVFVTESDSMGGGGGGSAVQIVVSGKDPEKLLQLVDQVKGVVASTPGAADPNTNWRLGQPEIQVRVDHLRTAYYDLSVNDVARTVRASINGETAGVYHDGDRDVDIVVRLDGASKQDVGSLKDIKIASGNTPVSLGQVADIDFGSGPRDIRRVDRQRAINVTCNVRDRVLSDFMQEVKVKLAEIKLQPGFSITYSGQDQNMNDSFKELAAALLLSILLVYMVLVMLYESFTTPFIRMLSLPLGIMGALVALAIFRYNLNLFTIIGVIMLDGLVAKNGTLLIDYTHTMMAQGKTLREALVEAATTRLRPIIMTTITMVFGMLPTALSLTEGAENRSGMAVVLIGGLLSSTVFTLFVIPVVYTIIDDWKHNWHERRRNRLIKKGLVVDSSVI
ncbi:acriflavin resistance protein [Desulfofarcimen acetoxidans DSM 771]|uniref:Acriflavin resistance protein n=1 Tax=Desulfofarcimen acetoxidans (strain ATCC 49208 / DSM 771 / KCTC 5769 / VKM B-1644 / 5575) TaxID=485916 RepID=C8VYH8_DESAS|nr:efflux RND transporter permease subunit [Desulfofarcimen acetoxidans]ACV62859.1 acriflavin resistance protein [Desulfofarcimen acetoxidans DSM 771]